MVAGYFVVSFVHRRSTLTCPLFICGVQIFGYSVWFGGNHSWFCLCHDLQYFSYRKMWVPELVMNCDIYEMNSTENIRSDLQVKVKHMLLQ